VIGFWLFFCKKSKKSFSAVILDF